VEFYIDPGQWTQDKLFELFDFTSWLAAATSRNVFVTLENSPEHCIFALRHGGQEIILPARPSERTAFGRGIAGRLSSILDPFKQKSRSLFADVPRTGAALEAARAWAALDQANDIAWHTELTASEFAQLRDLSAAFESFFGTLSPEQRCDAGGFKLAALRRQFWETLEQTRVRFELRL
jgi:hypothetical protein